MRALLLHRDRDADLDDDPSPKDLTLIEDLGLASLFDAMAAGDGFLRSVAQRTILSGLGDPGPIGYRQEALRDCLENPSAIRQLYEIAVGAMESPKASAWGVLSRTPSSVLYRSTKVLTSLLDAMRRLRRLSSGHSERFASEAFTRLFETIDAQLDDEYLDSVAGHLQELEFRRGVLISARLGSANEGVDHALRAHGERDGGLRRRLSAFLSRSDLSFRIAPRDENGSRALAELRDQGINLVADAAAQAVDHVIGFFEMLRMDAGFYVACLNLRDAFERVGAPMCFPTAVAAGGCALTATGLYDVGLALRTGEAPVGNDLAADGRSVVMVTGANQGGKSTFLRGIGAAQLMTQCGMFVGAKLFRVDVRSGVYTHFKREEDVSMRSGKLDEELARMSAIADELTVGGLVLFNESFSATNEREGSEIAHGVVRALVDAGVMVVFVTHMYELAHSFESGQPAGALFLRAERHAGGERTYRLLEGRPLSTSFGGDVYARVFETESGTLGCER